MRVNSSEFNNNFILITINQTIHIEVKTFLFALNINIINIEKILS